MPMGRPTDYRPEFCEQAVELGAQGKSYAQIGAAFGVARKTLYEWAERYPEFRDALARARDLSLSWWEEQAHTGMWESPEGLRLNPQLWSRSMAARFPDDYRESKKTEITGANGGPIQQAQVIITTGVPADFDDLA
jgi:transposase-like protein